MNINEYQSEAKKTARYPDMGDNIFYPTLGFAGEAGEVANKVKKIQRDKGGVIDEDARQKIVEELGDALWYLAQIATELNVPLADIAQGNLEKTQSRKKRGMLEGDGDRR